MLTINFQTRFVKAVENGLAELRGDPLPWPGVRPKRQTIRPYRKDSKDPKPGDWRALWTGLRTKARRKLGEVKCRTVQRIHVGKFDGARSGFPEVSDLDGRLVWAPDFTQNPFAAERRFAKRDGFQSWIEMSDWFEKTHELPFKGLLIRW